MDSNNTLLYDYRRIIALVAVFFVVSWEGAQSQECSDEASSDFKCGFTDELSSFDNSWWYRGQWYSSSPFGSYIYPPNVQFDSNYLRLTVTDRSETFSEVEVPFAGAQLQTLHYFGYGCYEVLAKPPKRSGIVSSFFLYGGPNNAATGYTDVHNEIDIEFIYKSSTSSFVMQANYYTAGQGGNEEVHRPSFDMESSFNWYGFKWTSTGIEWYVNGEKVHEASSNTPKVSAVSGPLHLMMNIWTIDPNNAGAVIWAGSYTHTGNVEALYDRVCHTDGESCEMPCSTAASGYGDPHFIGFNGERFDFHGVHGHFYVIFGQKNGDYLVARTRATGEQFGGMNKTYFEEFGVSVGSSEEKIWVSLSHNFAGQKLSISIHGESIVKGIKLGNLEVKFERNEEVQVITSKHMFCFKAVSVTSQYRTHIDFHVSLRPNKERSNNRYTGILGMTLNKKLGISHERLERKSNKILFEMMMRKRNEVASLFHREG